MDSPTTQRRHLRGWKGVRPRKTGSCRSRCRSGGNSRPTEPLATGSWTGSKNIVRRWNKNHGEKILWGGKRTFTFDNTDTMSLVSITVASPPPLFPPLFPCNKDCKSSTISWVQSNSTQSPNTQCFPPPSMYRVFVHFGEGWCIASSSLWIKRKLPTWTNVDQSGHNSISRMGTGKRTTG
jgi:hypothetical protein